VNIKVLVLGFFQLCPRGFSLNPRGAMGCLEGVVGSAYEEEFENSEGGVLG